MVIEVLFWILLVLAVIGQFGPPSDPNWTKGRSVIVVVLIAILGYAVFHNPLTH